MHLKNFFKLEEQRIIETCTACGLCAKRCPIIAQTDLADRKPKEVQKAVRDFLASGKQSPDLLQRTQSCMKCYGCIDVCPEGLNPLRNLEICTWQMCRQGITAFPDWDPKSPDLVHRVLASIQTTAKEYTRLFEPSGPAAVDTVFFPGCNVYYQPEKLLNALDIMERIGSEFAFLPGLDYCCGNCHLIKGRPGRAGDAFNELMQRLISYHPETVVLWCPTCFCLADATFEPIGDYPFRIESMAQYITRNLDKLKIVEKIEATVTIHDACKVALTDLDRIGSRKIAEAIGASIVEMPRSGQSAACCGCAAITNYPEAGNAMLDRRIEEARETGADIMVTVCHYCNQVLASRQRGSSLNVKSYINLLAERMGIHREDKFRKYMRWADKGRIMDDAASRIASSPFSRALIEQTITDVFCHR